MRLTIEDLEMLKELADELEEQHIETEKALQEDLGKPETFSYLIILPCFITGFPDAKEMEVHDQSKKIVELNAIIEDYEHTISQFREFVLQLQSYVSKLTVDAGKRITFVFFRELETLRAESQTAQSESATQASKASHIMSLNIKLQSSMSKTQSRNIDLELGKIEAQEARELLGIIQVCLKLYLFS